MKKFKLKGTNGREIVGNYLNMQLLRINDSDDSVSLKPVLIYTDEHGCVWIEMIDQGDQIEFL